MRQVLQNYRTGELIVAEVPVPKVRPGTLLVRTTASVLSAGTERQILSLARQGLLGKARARPDLVKQLLDKARREGVLATVREALLRLDSPTPLGYSSAGVIVDVGAGVKGWQPDDRGACAGAAFANHAEFAVVPATLCVPLPDGVPFETGAFASLGAIAMQGIRQAAVEAGAWVAVIGLGLIGQLTIQLLRGAGCRVLGVDLASDRLVLAKAHGADLVATPADAAAYARAAGVETDAVIITATTTSNAPIVLAGELARPRGVVVMVGVTGMEIPRRSFWEKELQFRLSKAMGPGSDDPPTARWVGHPRVRWTARDNLEAVVSQMARGHLRVDQLITVRFPIAQARGAYRLLQEGRGVLGIVLTYPGSPEVQRVVPLSVPVSRTARAVVRVGIIGAGLFGRTTLLPALRAISGVQVRAVATATGLTAQHVAAAAGAAYATSDPDALLADDRIDAVIIATRHDQHAALTVRALRAGKHVFVEKPPALTIADLAEILAAARSAAGVFAVGFNRRFAPLVRVLREVIGEASVLVVCRANAGEISDDHWVHDPREGGGRVLSEGCHFVDLVQYLTAARPVRVFAQGQPGAASAAITLELDDGSVGVVAFSGQGDRAFPRERVEVFGPQLAAALDEYRRLEVVRAGRRTVRRRLESAKGYREELDVWIRAVRGQTAPPAVEDPLLATLATLQALASLRSGRPEPVGLELLQPGT